MTRKTFLLFPLLLAAAVSCEEMPQPEEMGKAACIPGLTKAVNTADLAMPGEIMIKTVDALAPEIGTFDWTATCERLFPDVPGTEERARLYELDKWWLVKFSDKENLVDVARDINSLDKVKTIEFCMPMVKGSDGNSRPFSDFAGTKAVSNWSPFNDPMVGNQWHYYNIGDVSIAPTAKAGADINVKDCWRLCTGDPRIVVAIIDEGVCSTHPDLIGNLWTNEDEIPGNGVDDDNNGYVDDIHGYNFVSNGPVSWGKPDDSGHGTHIAGTISAVNNNGIGVCGIAGGDGSHGGVKIMSCQVFDGKYQSASGFARAMKYAADNGASIVQCSYGYTAGAISSDAAYSVTCEAEMKAIAYFLDKSNCPEALDGNVAIYAAGNDNTAMSGYPGAYYRYISVAAIGADNLPTYYTNYGPGTNISAPGGEYYTGGQTNNDCSAVLSTLPTENQKSGYGYMQGTSMACPHVTGVAALGLSYMLQRGIKLTNNEFMSKLLTSVNDIDDYLVGEKISLVNRQIGSFSLSPYRKNMGTGSIDAWRFLMQLDGVPSLTAVVGQSQRLDITSYFGGCAKNLTYLDVSMSKEDMDAIGVTENPSIAYGKLKINPTKPGCAKLEIKAIGGGETLGDGRNMGGIELNRTISIVARGVNSGNGGWL